MSARTRAAWPLVARRALAFSLLTLTIVDCVDKKRDQPATGTSAERSALPFTPATPASASASAEPAQQLVDGMGGTRVLPVQYGMILVQHGLAGIRRANRPKLEHEPDDHDERYLACDEITSAPTLTPSLWHSAITYADDASSCEAKVGRLTACSWSMRTPWLAASPPAVKIFADGEKFVAAQIQQEGCGFSRWASFDVGVSLIRPVTATPEQASIALRDLPTIGPYSGLQSEYQDFRDRLAARAKTSKRSASTAAALPSEWLSLDGSSELWTIPAGSGSPELLLGFFRRAISLDDPAAVGAAPDFCVSLLAIWSISADNTLRFLGPTQAIVHGCADFGIAGSMKSRPGVPLILYETTGVIGGLRFEANRFVEAPELTYRVRLLTNQNH